MGKIIKVREVGDPVLNKISEEVDITNINNDILDIIDDLKATLEDGVGLGIAAPQIGISKRIIVVGAKKENVRYNDAEDIPLTAMINPKWEKSADETDIQFEACLSVPAIAGKVERFKHITLQYYNEQGEKIEKEIHGFFARLFQIFFHTAPPGAPQRSLPPSRLTPCHLPRQREAYCSGISFHLFWLPLTRELSAKPTEGETFERHGRSIRTPEKTIAPHPDYRSAGPAVPFVPTLRCVPCPARPVVPHNVRRRPVLQPV